ncbi:ero1-like protein [Anthonomus grandis grandis]|uniref:ero1-like protein n=1 Tax=Anthonomus grandis grandis TaxID=2921223 RepID=UPI00216576D5|nr:ero1-like protein [Anthonomus grandis grandis]
MCSANLLKVLLCTIVLNQCLGFFNQPQGTEKSEPDDCFCQLEGKIDECNCKIDTVDSFNNVKIFPRLQSLLVKDFFRFFKVNLRRPCPFWVDDSKCAMRYCHVEYCEQNEIPEGLKGEAKPATKYTENGEDDCDEHTNLGYLNTTISEKAQLDIEKWLAHDQAQDNFCVEEENGNDSEYVDLLLNPERFTGYAGESAHRIWRTIYLENCFRPKNTFSFNPYIQTATLNSMCLEERVFYRAISGLHASINIHLSANYLLSNKHGLSLKDPKGEWGPYLEEFRTRFSPESTNGEGPHWLRNLYFVYLIELRALAKAAPYLEREDYYTGNASEDYDTKMAIKDLLSVIKKFPDHFDETTMFKGTKEAEKLKYEFKQHFRNITRIMDCVGCDKCRLWGKLQTQGLGTALKILFGGQFDYDVAGNLRNRKEMQLKRNEIVSLLNAIGRLSTSIYKLDDFRQMMR